MATTDPRRAVAAAVSMSASASTTSGSLPPSSRNAGTNRSPARAPTKRPVATLPVKQTASTASTTALPVSGPPRTQSNTAATSGTVRTASMRGSTNRGVCSLGLQSTAQPAARAGTASISISSSGKFQGEMTPTSPSGTARCSNRTLGTDSDTPAERSARSSGAFLPQWSMRRRAPSISASDRSRRPVSFARAATISARRSRKAPHHLSRAAMRSPGGRAAHSTCAPRRRSATAETSCRLSARKRNPSPPRGFAASRKLDIMTDHCI